MKKLLVFFMVVAFVAPVIPAMADDTLDLSGAMRVRAFAKTDHDWNSDADADEQYWDQRFRIQGTITPADSVKGVFRVDLAENTWGADGVDDQSSNEAGVAVDRAYLAINKGIASVSAGLQWVGLGNSVAYDAVHTGIVASIATPVTITLAYFKVDEDQTNGADEDMVKSDEDGYEDIDHYAINLGYAADTMSVNVFYATQIDGQDPTTAIVWDDIDADMAKVDASVIGLQGKFAVGPVNINAELDIFSGTYETTTTELDLVGTQFFADISMVMSDALTVGAHLVYSDGEDEADEVKITHLTDDGSTVFSDYGAMNTLGISPLGATDIFDADLNDDGFADGTGTTGAGLYVKFMAMESLTLYGQVMYATATEELDNTTGELDSLMLFNVSAKYTIVPNAHLSVQYGYFNAELQDNADADPASTLGARLQIDF
jgi:hypothetical protein